MAKHGYRIAQIVQDNQGWIALICGEVVVARFTNWTDAKAAYRNITRKG
jgi:hypothetical protein